jgi:hypothetical protein
MLVVGRIGCKAFSLEQLFDGVGGDVSLDWIEKKSLGISLCAVAAASVGGCQGKSMKAITHCTGSSRLL